MEASSPTVTVHVDPSCPFAWITWQWLREVERLGRAKLQMRLLSLAVVNEDRDVDPWYRRFNDAAWGPARVMVAASREGGDDAARRFYEAFGHRLHVVLDTADDADRLEVAFAALIHVGLPTRLVDAADNPRWDAVLRADARRGLDAVGLDVGVTLVEIDGVTTSGPVLSSVPRGHHALALFEAVRTLARQRGFIRIERQRPGELQPA